MTALVLDTCFQACSAALVAPGEKLLASQHTPMTTGQAEALMPMIARVLADGQRTAGDLSAIVVTTGPGSFTGARIGVAAAQGLALATGVEAYGVSALQLVAAAAFAADPNAERAAAVMDARGGNVYLEIVDRDGHASVGPSLLPMAEAARAVTVVGTEGRGRGLVLSGAAALRLKEAMGAAGAGLSVDTSYDGQPAAAALAGHVARIVREGRPARPLYLRPPDAKPQDDKSLARAS